MKTPLLHAPVLRLRFWKLLAVAAFLSSVAPARALVDFDADGWSDLWQSAYGRGHVAGDDDDGDGRTNAEEHGDGTDPADAASVRPVPTVLEKPKGTFLVSWPTIAGKLYQLQFAVDGGEWINLAGPQAGSGADIVLKYPKTTTRFTGGARYSRWLNMDGSSSVSGVKTRIASTVAPDTDNVIASIETPQTSPGISRFGQWIRGWIMPPASGKYTFWISSDDASELWLSPTADPAGKRLIASVTEWTNFREWTKYQSQVSLQISLTLNKPVYFEVFHKDGSGGDHVSVAWTGPKLSPDKEILGGKYVLTDPATLAQKLGATGVPAWRVIVSDRDSDGDGLSDYEEALAGLDPLNAKTVPRIKDIDSVRTLLNATNTITVGTEGGRGYERGGQPCRFTFFRAGNINPLRVRFSASGTAAEGEDFAPLSGVVDLPVGQNSVSIDLEPTNDGVLESAETLTVTVLPDAAYIVGSPDSATATIDDAPDTVFVANLTAGTGAKTGGYGTAALRVAGNDAFATFSLSFGNLSAAHAGTELYVLGAGNRPIVVWTLEPGQIATGRWEFEDVIGVSRAQIIDALKKGKLFARLISERFPGGEIAGKFVKQLGSKAPPRPPAYGPTLSRARNDGEAARFLTQATFGPTADEVAKVKKMGFAAWIADQQRKPATMHLPYVQARRAELLARNAGDDGWQTPRQEAWWQAALAAPDQLRQRMAFALSEIFVVSDIGTLEGSHEGITNYYDLLAKNAFGNFRTLIEEITLSPIMGQYLSMVRNQKPNPDTGAEPDENYAREVMQLFSIGLSMLNTDGSLQLDANGMPIPTYTQDDIIGLAHVFTGWGYAFDPAAPPATASERRSHFLYGEKDEINRMVMFEEFHDTKPKRLIRGVLVPAGQTGAQDLKLALDTLANHPNVGPFLARQLIQRFVTSNPSRGYIHRVATVFKSSKGNLGTTLRAVLLDAEARNPVQPLAQGYGKLREPLLRMAHTLRAFKAAPPVANEPRFFLDLQYAMTTQAPLKSGSVFNFFQPGFIQPGPIAQAGLYSPEFQITSETTVVSQSNSQNAAILNGFSTRERDPVTNNSSVKLNLDAGIAILSEPGGTAAENQAALLDHLNVLLCNGQMTPGLRAAVMNAWGALPANYGTGATQQRDRVRLAIYIITTSPEYCVQK